MASSKDDAGSFVVENNSELIITNAEKMLKKYTLENQKADKNLYQKYLSMKMQAENKNEC